METVGTRIRQRIAQLHIGVPEKEIAASVEMAPDVFSRSLNGKRTFTSVELAHLAERLSTSMYWLATGEADPFEARIAARHEYDFASGRYVDDKGGSTSQTLDNIELAYRQVYPGRNDAATPVAGPDEIRARLGEDFISDFSSRVEEVLDIDVVRVEGVTSAYSLRAGGRYCIVVPRSGNWFRQNSDIAHELGHIYLGHFNDRDETASDVKEGPAFDFAAQILLPESVVRSVDWETIKRLEIVNFLWETGVSTKYLANRLRKLSVRARAEVWQLLDQSTFDVLNRPLEGKTFSPIAVGVRTQRAAERRFPEALIAAHVEAVTMGKVPKETLAWLLDVSPDEIDVHPPQSTSIDLDDLAAELGLAAGA
ncbi:ImmA/IrrE family metallo-endopeptidase [Arthrobacter sp. ISL-65]|uniref:ImmA/IrrE family metallo-endopeptidase n=1 Tax=Arthrobacter sp. ISL-65 TaxID=2819112 RepID=UPI001BED20CB|nr:ImmA/IrrE family metallo-endopeptidase [Arthrobacter sp. ISL-65]MBT2550967.1 ImmA/IrrE family metallo-endopeptidase [Arthrobacter sp. ISL-65]